MTLKKRSVPSKLGKFGQLRFSTAAEPADVDARGDQLGGVDELRLWRPPHVIRERRQGILLFLSELHL